ncbi:TAZ zinc finger [Ostertagia ostertagi]
MMDGRDTFLTRARDEHWEFSSLRRAKFSTLALCHALHESDVNKDMSYTCNKCNSSNAKWHCTTCDVSSSSRGLSILCETCRESVSHEHPMEQIKPLIGAESGDSSGNNRFESIQRCILSLVHACQCRDANCRRVSCHKMKRAVTNTRRCARRGVQTVDRLVLLPCKALFSGFVFGKGSSPHPTRYLFCMNIRQKLAEQKRSIARRADMMMRRRIDGLQAVAGGPTSSSSSAVSVAGGTSVPTPPPDNKPFAGTHMKGGIPGPSPLTQVPTMSSMPSHPQAGQPQQQQRGGFMSSGMMPPQQQQQQQPPGGMSQMGQGMGGGGMGGPMGQHPGGQPMPPGGRGAGGQPPPPYRAPTPMVGFNQPSMMQPGMSMHPGMGQMRNPMAQVVNRFKMAKTDEEKQSAFQELKKTPHLFAAFIKMKPNSEMVGGSWQSSVGLGGPQPGYYGGPPPQGGVRASGNQFAPMGPGGWQQQQQFHQQRQQQGQSPAISGQHFGVGQGRSPSMGMGSSPMLPPQQTGQPDQSGQFR